MGAVEDIEKEYGHHTADAFLAAQRVLKVSDPTTREVARTVCLTLLLEGLEADASAGELQHHYRVREDTEGYQHYWWDNLVRWWA